MHKLQQVLAYLALAFYAFASADEGGASQPGSYPEPTVDGPQPKEVPHPDPYKAKKGENVLALPLQPKDPFGEIRGDDVDKGGDVTKACRYDEPAWSNCDPFELTQHKVLHLVSGGRECEEEKTVIQRCTPFDLPAGTKWLIAEHRRCISEMKRLKLMIADMSKYITALRTKGKTLFDSYLVLKKHLDAMTHTLKEMQTQLAQSVEKVKELRQEMESWKVKARDLQAALDDLKKNYHDLEMEHKAGARKLQECTAGVSRCKAEIVTLQKTLVAKKNENSELKRRLMDAQKYKDEKEKVRRNSDKVHLRHEQLLDKLEMINDDLAECKIDLLNKKNLALNYKDTKMDMSMDMWIIHNRSDVTAAPEEATTYKPTYQAKRPKCLISYYGVTNESCYYQSDSESGEADFQDTLGEHLVEAKWKYFTIDVADAYECDRSAHLHYEFLINRCRPEHHLPVLSVFRPDANSKELTTHIYPRPNIPQPNHPNRCWITFLGPQGHCERRKDKYPLYNSDDTVEGYRYSGSGVSKTYCLQRARVWSEYCENPAIATYIPEGVSSNWRDADIQHDNHGGRMFEEKYDVKKQINPHSYNPHDVKKPVVKLEEQFEDTEEYRKSLNMPEGPEKEALLQGLKHRLGIKGEGVGGAVGQNKKVNWQGVGKEGTASQSASAPAPAMPHTPAADGGHKEPAKSPY